MKRLLLTGVYSLMTMLAVYSLGSKDTVDTPVENLDSWLETVDISQNKPGKYNILITAEDLAGNQGFAGPYNMYIDPDSDLPVTQITNPLHDMRVPGNLNIVGTSIDDDAIEFVEIILDDNDTAVRAEGKEFWSFYLDTTDLSEGAHTISVYGVDIFGVRGHPHTVTWHLDRNRPETTVISLEMGALVSGTFVLSGTITDGNGIRELYYSIDNGESYSPVSAKHDKDAGLWRFNVDIESREMPDGPAVCWFKAVDGEGSEGINTFLYFVDNTPPDVGVISPLPDEAVNGVFSVSGYARDILGLERLSWSFDKESGDFEIVKGNPYWVQEFDISGVNTRSVDILVTAEDTAGNVTTLKHKILVDQALDIPSLEILKPEPDEILENRVLVTGFARDDDAVAEIRYTVDKNEQKTLSSSGSFGIELDELSAGAHSIELLPVDVHGVPGEPVSRSFVVAGALPEILIDTVEGPLMQIHPEAGKELTVIVVSESGLEQVSWQMTGKDAQDVSVRTGAKEHILRIPVGYDVPFGLVNLVVTAKDIYGREKLGNTVFHVTNLSIPRGTPPDISAEAGRSSGEVTIPETSKIPASTGTAVMTIESVANGERSFENGMIITLAGPNAPRAEQTASDILVGIESPVPVTDFGWSLNGGEVRTVRVRKVSDTRYEARLVLDPDIPADWAVIDASAVFKDGSGLSVRGYVCVVRPAPATGIFDDEQFVWGNTVRSPDGNIILLDGKSVSGLFNGRPDVTAASVRFDRKIAGLDLSLSGNVVTVTGSADGEYAGVSLVVTDSNGGAYTSAPVTFIVDSAPPEIVLNEFDRPVWLQNELRVSGSARDSFGIQTVEYSLDGGSGWQSFEGARFDRTLDISTLATSGWFAATTAGTLSGYEMSIPVNTETVFPAGQTSHSFTMTATDFSEPPMTASREVRIHYDNIPPDVSAPYGGVTPIRNSNGSYEFKSIVEEAQSGFDRVMVVLHRPAAITPHGGRVYNPRYASGATGNVTAWSLLAESPEGLPLMEYTGAIRPDSTSLTHADVSEDPYAQEGNYLRIGGLYYLITDVTGDTISWEGDVDDTVTSFEMVYAMAVDKLTTEVSDQDGDGIIEAVTRSGGTYYWSCSIDSTNLPDGQMHIRYVAFDKAGNFDAPTDIETHVENNPPLLAQVTLATDLDGSTDITDGSDNSLDEWNPPYSTLAGGLEQKIATVDATSPVNPFTAKDFMEVVIDVVGGNGDLQYRLDVDGSEIHTIAAANLRSGAYNELDPSTNTITVTRSQLEALTDDGHDFVFSIWDSTETYALGTSTDFMAELTVTLTVDVDDDIEPVTVVSPFIWNDADDNSLYQNSRTNGHIELEADLPVLIFNQASGLFDTDPKVSGKISIRGTAYDDQRITALWMYVGDTAAAGNFNFPPTAATKTFGTKIYYRMATYVSGSGWSVTSGQMETNGWTFSVEDEYLNQDGHLVSWQLDWDTAKLDTIAAVDRYIRIVAEDKRTTPNHSLETLISTPVEVATNNVPFYRMDVVPYITNVVTGLSSLKANNPSVYNRTALGRYPVNESETLTVNGFNLRGAAVAGATGESTTDGVLSVPMATAVTGALVVSVNGVGILNNNNSDTAEYNQMPNGDNNYNLLDDVAIDVWEFNNRAAMPTRGIVTDPVMKINPVNDRIGFAFANGPDYFNMSNGTNNSYTQWQRNYDDFYHVAMAYDASGRSHGLVVGRDINSYSDHGGRFVYVTSRWGIGMINNQDGNYDGVNAIRFESIGVPTGTVVNGVPQTTAILDKSRLRSPQIAVAQAANGTNRVYVAYYDDINQQIRFRYGNHNSNVKTEFGQFDDRNDGNNTVFESYADDYSIVADTYGTTPNEPGEYLALGLIPGADAASDVAVLAWFDYMNQQLLFSYKVNPQNDNNASTTTGNGYWSTPIQIFAGAGEHCQLAIDSDGGIHIVAYDNTQANLQYAYLQNYSDDTPETATVDSYGIVGTNITIDVAKNAAGVVIPHIGYYMVSTQMPKLAVLADTSSRAPEGVVNDQYTGAWEISLVPTAARPTQDRINVALWKDGTGTIKDSVNGTSNSSTTTGTCYGNGTNNPVFGYAIKEGTSGYIETAQIR